MKKIVLLCSAGMSTGMMVQRIKESAQKDGYELDINAYSLSEAKKVASDADMVLLGPQVAFCLNKVKEDLPGIKVEVIDMVAYGMMDGNKVFNRIKEVLA